MPFSILQSITRRCLNPLQTYKDIVLTPRPHNREQLTAKDIILLSYPRSGNTWARHLIADLIQQSLGFETTTILPIEVWKVVPSIYTQNLTELVADPVWRTYRLVKSHEHQDLGNRKAIYIVRKPEDVLCSWYRFNCNTKAINTNDISIDKFCRDKLNEWIKHVEMAIKYHEKNPKRMLWVCYELLHQNPHSSLHSIVQFLNLCNVNIDKAVQNHTFHARKKVATQKEFVFATCQGTIGSGKQELQKKTQQFIEETAHPLYEKAYFLSVY